MTPAEITDEIVREALRREGPLLRKIAEVRMEIMLELMEFISIYQEEERKKIA